MTIAEWLVNSMVELKEAGVPNGRTDALILLADLFETDKSWVHTHPEYELDDLQVRELKRLLDKRTARNPLAYIRGFSEFYGRRFMVNSHVLVPRPESETMIEMLQSIQSEFEVPRIADIGTGSGCLGITAALEHHEAIVHLYDISADALGVAYHNARQHDLELQYYESDLLKQLQPGNYDIFLANLPYVPKKLITSPEIEKEPALALFSGVDGLKHYRAFWKQVRKLPFKPKYILTEALENQHGSNETLALNAGYKLVRTDILIQLFTIDKGRQP